MNDAACTVFVNLINLAVRMMPIFMCMEPKHKNKENIAAVSAYLWVLMVSMESVFHIDPRAFLTFRGIFSCLFFLVLLVFLGLAYSIMRFMLGLFDQGERLLNRGRHLRKRR